MVSHHQTTPHHKHPPPHKARLSLVDRAKRATLSLTRVAILCFVLRIGIEYFESKGWLSKLGHAQEFILAAITNKVLFEMGE